MKRVHLIISGDVQGVGYRAWAIREANKLELVGWVRNRSDGAVEIIAEGPKDKLDELVTRCQDGPDVACVEKVETTWDRVTGEYVTFGVVY